MFLNWNAGSTYDNYFGSGTYTSRYPTCNHRSLDLILTHADGATRILDFGCGNGRYTLPLLERTTAQITACDISETALNELKTRLIGVEGQASDRVDLICGSIQAMPSDRCFDVAIAMFGVIAHVPTRQARLDILNEIRHRLSPHGVLIISVPNALRRFFKEQFDYARQRGQAGYTLEPGDIIYRRTFANQQVYDLYYHLYTVASLQQELSDAGFLIDTLHPESILSESLITRQPQLCTIDTRLTSWLPAWLGYGILAIARPN